MIRTVQFRFGSAGPWSTTRTTTIAGAPLDGANGALDIVEDGATRPAALTLRGVASNVRYATRAELTQLRAVQEDLGRPAATCAALIPITKSAEWWALSQDERRAIFEEQSHHNATGLRYLPQIARKLYHGRDLGEPFDFLTWFEFAPEHEGLFDDLVGALRASPEWAFVTREVDIRLRRSPSD